MNHSPNFNEEEVRDWLGGRGAELEAALEVIHRELQRPVCSWIRRRFFGLSAEDLADIWSETLQDVLQAAQQGRYDPQQSLFGWICSIARNQVVDSFRRRKMWERVLEAATAMLRQQVPPERWRTLDRNERAEFLELLRDALVLLPSKQRIVFQAYINHFPDTLQMHVLKQEVSRMTGEPETLANMRRSLGEGLQKVRAYLRAHGYGTRSGGESA